MTESKVTKEQAEKEFETFVETMDLDCDVDGMDDEDKAGFSKHRALIVRSIMRGSLVFDDESQPVFTPAHKDSAEVSPVTFYEPTGANYMEMDRKKAGKDMAKMHAVIAGMTKRDAKLFAGLKNRDYKVCLAIALLFLG